MTDEARPREIESLGHLNTSELVIHDEAVTFALCTVVPVVGAEQNKNARHILECAILFATLSSSQQGLLTGAFKGHFGALEEMLLRVYIYRVKPEISTFSIAVERREQWCQARFSLGGS